MAFLTFFLASLSLLAVPGPTNTLLATSGGCIGVARSLPLLAAELSGYFLAISLLRLVLGPIINDVPIIGIILRTAVTLYVFHLAGTLWRRSVRTAPSADRTVTFGHVLVATLLNPKAVVFALLLLPAKSTLADLLPWFATLAFQIVTAGAAWLAIGAALGRGARHLGYPQFINRAGAIALFVMAGLTGLGSLVLT